MKRTKTIAVIGFTLATGMTAFASPNSPECNSAKMTYAHACQPLNTPECHSATKESFRLCSGTDLTSPECTKAQGAVARVCSSPECTPARHAAERACGVNAAPGVGTAETPTVSQPAVPEADPAKASAEGCLSEEEQTTYTDASNKAKKLAPPSAEIEAKAKSAISKAIAETVEKTKPLYVDQSGLQRKYENSWYSMNKRIAIYGDSIPNYLKQAPKEKQGSFLCKRIKTQLENSNKEINALSGKVSTFLEKPFY